MARENQKIFFTLVKLPEDDWRVTNDITSLCVVLFGEHRFDLINVPEGKVVTHRGSRKNYEKFAKLIEKAHPGVCEFDYKLR